MTTSRKVSIASAICIALSIFSPAQSARAASTLPTAPQTLRATAVPVGLALTWTPPSDIATGITAYQAEYSLDGSIWTVAANNIASNAVSYSITGLSSLTSYYVRLAALVSGGTGPYAYPWTKLYGTVDAKRTGTSINYQNGYGPTGDTATSNANSQFTRVRYLVAANNSGTANWADIDFAKWDTRTDTNLSYSAFTTPAATVPYLRIPSTASGEQFVIKTNVNDLTVNSSVSSLIGYKRLGRLEIWPYDYNTMSTSLTPANANATFDWDDAPAMSSGYGSFQIFDLADTHTVFAWNNHSGNPDVGFGNQGSGHPDWTFAANFSYGTHTISVEIFANFKVTSGNMGIGSVTIDALTGNIKKRTAKTITARTAGPGFVTFYANGRKIAGCISVATSANMATCSWRPLTQGQNTVTATFTSPMYTSASGSASPSTVGKR
jgi:hypothetical protein